MTHRLSLGHAGLALAAAAIAAHAQRPVDPSGPYFHKLVSIDSENVRSGALSPNSRWLMVDKGDAALWIVPAGGRGKPARW